ncbi:MAG TPA: hypothetical protein VKI19_05995 [Acidimicrobiales bacterium]|nr:hypothetical protein [Acidimicrobiales bacterium]
MAGAFTRDGGVVVIYTVQGSPGPTTTTIPAAQPPTPAVTHQPLPLTGAPVTLELIGSFGLLAAGALTAIAARRRGRSAG